MSKFLDTEAIDASKSRRSARGNEGHPVGLNSIIQPIPPAPEVAVNTTVPNVTTLDPKLVAIQDLFRRMEANKLTIQGAAKPEFINFLEGKNADRWSTDVTRRDDEGNEESGLLLLALAVKLPSSDLTEGRRSAWRFKPNRNGDNSGPTTNATLTNMPLFDLNFTTKIRTVIVPHALGDLDSQMKFDLAATMEYLRRVDDAVLHKASELCFGLIEEFDTENASNGDKALIKGTDAYEKGLKELILGTRSADFLVQRCTHP